MSETTDVFIDFLCPYAWRGVELAAVLREQGESFRLRHYSLVEGNHAANQKEHTWNLTDQPLDAPDGDGYMKHQTPSLRAFLAATAAARQGEEALWAFSLALFRLRHEQQRELDDAAMSDAAAQAGLDAARFEQDRQDEAGLRADLRAEQEASREIGVFGTPTYVLPGGEAAYYRFENLTRDPATAREWWNLYTTVLRSDPGVATIKRARNRPAQRM
ncbi:DsbA family protein [Deinococcus sp. KSM4-11]|uniref:DsbA family protein n=1 Tax=Deinococcus sp. KSM4-11 TaxID=2568654 RepID=UPI0010A32CA0|nr:DsbA family protein [Deinococcus sp. KSM4-11]THF83608.1 DsbA family protein [Deinococcus sp. KSM4-11]